MSEPDPEDLARSAAILRAAGYAVLDLAAPLGRWHLVGLCRRGPIVLAVMPRGSAPVEVLGAGWGRPAHFPRSTRRLVHRWGDGPEPETISL